MADAIPIPQIGMLILGAVLFFIAPKIVGMILRILGIALILVGGVMYQWPERFVAAVDPTSIWATIIAVIPLVAGIALIAVGEGMAKMAVRIAGALLVLSGLAGLGLIG